MSAPPTSVAALVGGSRLARNSVLSFIGQGFPLLAAIFAAPRLIHGLGSERFGLLTLAWTVIGYFSIFDLGLGRAITQVAAVHLAESPDAKAPKVVWTALAMMLLLGLGGAAAVGTASHWMVGSLFRVPSAMKEEALGAFYLLAAGIPVVVLTAGFMGLLAAFQRFDVLSAIRIPTGLFTFLSPLAVLPFSRSLVPITGVLLIGRLFACLAYMAASIRLLPPVDRRHLLDRAAVAPLFHFGAWMTVSNLISPLLQYLDRFLIGSIVSIAAVAYYATPYEMITKLLIVPGGILAVLFPAIATSYRADPGLMARLFERGAKYIGLLLFPATLVTIAFSFEGLRWWLGEEFASNGAVVLRWLALGVFINSLAQVLITVVHGVGRPDLSAKLHLAELCVYLPTLWWALRSHGIAGAAVVWTGRVALDGAMLFWLTGPFLQTCRAIRRRVGTVALLALVCLGTPLLIDGLLPRAVLVAVLAVLFPPLTWRVLLEPDERLFLIRLVGLKGDAWTRAQGG